MFTTRLLGLLTLALVGMAGTSSAQVATYDATSRLLILPAVKVGASTYLDVRLLDTGNFNFTLQSATEQVPPGNASTVYDDASSLLTIPAVKVGSVTYLDVTLLNLGNFTFSLQSAAELPASTRAEIEAAYATVETRWATAVPTPGNVTVEQSDGCYLHNGRTRANVIEFIDADLAGYRSSEAYRVGRNLTNVQVLARRTSSNPDGSTRTEIDSQVDVMFKDGTSVLGAKTTWISGSSAGTPGCSTPQTGANWRDLGNQHKVGVDVRARNVRDERHSISTGAPLSPAINYRRDVQWRVTDPMGNATYVVVTGPGPTVSANGANVPFSLLLLSPRVQRSAPEFAGKSGQYLNWRDLDSFRMCRTTGTGVPVLGLADCVGQGTGGDNWGWSTATPDTAADQSFNGYGFMAGGVYTFAVYNDDGWKTVNGHVGRTPIATYRVPLESLPYTFVEMAGTGTLADKFPRLGFAGMTSVQVRNNLVSATPSAMNAQWVKPPPLSDGRQFMVGDIYEYFHGVKVGNAGGASFPRHRYVQVLFPASTALSFGGLAVSATPAEIVAKTYAEFAVEYQDRDSRWINSIMSFQ